MKKKNIYCVHYKKQLKIGALTRKQYDVRWIPFHLVASERDAGAETQECGIGDRYIVYELTTILRLCTAHSIMCIALANNKK